VAAPSTDALYAARAHLSSARQAAAAWKAELAAQPGDFDAGLKLSHG
jgi:hypothetical protein